VPEYIPASTPEELGELIRRRRNGLGLRQEDLALAAGTGRRFIGELERGKRTARLGDVLGVLRTLGVQVAVSMPEADAGGDQANERP